MATRTSTQSGNFNSTSTWGGSAVPVDGDLVVVAAGTEVTVSDDQRPTNGFGDITCNGKFTIANSGKVRANGKVYINASGSNKHYLAGDSASGGFFRMSPGSLLEIRGTNADQHGVYLNSHQYTTLEMQGSDATTDTTISGGIGIGDQSFTPVGGVSNFAAGDWCSIYKSFRTSMTQNYNKSDEGFVVHDTSGSLIYIRHYVSPYTAISAAVSSTVLKVADASVFRFGSKIVFGTGANLNAKEITAIDYNINTITVNSAIAGTVTGEIVYKSGFDKPHISGDTLTKVATAITADASAGASTITVASTAGFSVGDEIALPNTNIEYTSTWNFQQNYKISNINGNTITLAAPDSAGSSYNAATLAQAYKSSNHNDVCFCYNLTRDTVIRGVDASQYVYIYSVYWTSGSAYYRRFLARRVQFYWLGGSTSDVYRGMRLRGRLSFSVTNYGAYVSRFEDCSVRLNGGNNPNGNSSNHRVSWGDQMYYVNMRNSCFFNTYYGVMFNSGNERGVFNNISFWQGYSSWYISGWYGARNELSYNLSARADDYAWIFYHVRVANSQFYQNRVLCSHNRHLYQYYCTNGGIFDTCYVDGYRYWAYAPAGGGNPVWHNSYLGNDWDPTGNSRVYTAGIQMQYDGSAYPYYGGGNKSIYHSICHNFKHNGLATWGSGQGATLRIWDHDENAWRYYNDYDYDPGNATTQFGGTMSMVYLPAGTKLMLRCAVKRIGTSTATLPYLEIRQQYDSYDLGYYLGTTTGTSGAYNEDPITTAGGTDPISPSVGWHKRSQFPAFTTTAYTEHTLTLEPLKQSCMVMCGVAWYEQQVRDPGWYEKPVEIFMDSRNGPYNNALCGHIGNSWTTPVQMLTRETPSTQALRLGGRMQ